MTIQIWYLLINLDLALACTLLQAGFYFLLKNKTRRALGFLVPGAFLFLVYVGLLPVALFLVYSIGFTQGVLEIIGAGLLSFAGYTLIVLLSQPSTRPNS